VSFIATGHESQSAIPGALRAAGHRRLEKSCTCPVGRVVDFAGIGDADRGAIHHDGPPARVCERAILRCQDLLDVGSRGQHREDGVGICAGFGNGIRDRNPEGARLSARLFVDIEASDHMTSAAHMV